MRFMGYELTMDTKLTTDNQNIPFPSHSSKQKKKKCQTDTGCMILKLKAYFLDVCYV